MKRKKTFKKRIFNALKTVGLWGIIKLIFVNIKLYYLRIRKTPSYSQLFEDYFLDSLMKHSRNGFYVDIGANDPFNLNNTAFFYQKGWHGINIEPDMQKFNLLKEKRPDDININMGVGKNAGILKFYRFKDSSLCTFSEDEAKKRVQQGVELIGETEVFVDTLANILAKNIPSEKRIDFISIDVEGLNRDVLYSNDWKKYRPRYVCIEVAEYCKDVLTKDMEIVKFLEKQKYKEVFFNGINSIFKDIKKNEK